MKHFYKEIQGWFDFQELYTEMVSIHDNAHFVEVGVWKGKSTCFLAVEIINQNKNIQLDTIDNYSYLTEEYKHNKNVPKEFKKNIEPFKFIHPIYKDSVEATRLYKDKSIDFIFFDSEHTEEYATKEIEVWYPKLKIGGFIGGHDYVSFLNPNFRYIIGVGNAVNKIFNDNFKLYPGKRDNEGRIYGPSWLHKKLEKSIR
tara:strand:- start:78 stop:677 length:600 start_codon:yes stop_codon:yes gene_type:complete